MRSIAVLLLLAGAASAAPDALKDWKSGQRTLAREEKRFWRNFKKAWVDANEVFWRPWRERGSEPNPLGDYTGHARLFDEYVRLQQARGGLDAALATSGHEKAGETLLDALLDLCKQTDALDAAILRGRPVHRSIFDQEPAVKRHGLTARRATLVDALAAVPDGAGFLAGEGWTDAERKDGRRSVSRRVAVIDALGKSGDVRGREKLQALLAAPELPLRVAAVEGLLRFGAEARPALVPLLGDGAWPVRRALVTGLPHDDPAWIAPLVAAYPDTTGVLRQDCVRALGALTRQTFGDAPEQWREWLADYRKRIESGAFEKKDVEVREAKPTPVAGGLPFYDATIRGDAVFVVDGSRRLWWPASWEVQKTRYKYDWDRTLRTWEDEHASNQRIVGEQLARALGAADDEFTFGVVLLQDNFKTERLSKRLVSGKSKRAAALRFVADDVSGDGWCAPLEGLFEALRLAGVGPDESTGLEPARVSTIVLVHAGDPSGGRYLNAQAVIDAFTRLNRFRRLVVHTVRIANDGPEAEALMKELAAATGGTYTWAGGAR